MDVAAFHEAEHLAREAAHRQRLAVECAGEGVQRGHDVGDGSVAVLVCVGRGSGLGFIPNTRVGLLHHLLAEVDADEVVLKDVVVKHILGRFAEVDDPLGQRGWTYAEGHILRVDGAGGVIISTDAADTTGDEVGVARIFPLHEDRVAAEDG